MKAHSMRRSIWFLNVALAAAAVGVGAWYFLDVKPAVAETPRPVNRKPPEKWAKIVKTFGKQIDEARTDVLRPPVRTADIEDAFKIEDYKGRDPAHFIFTGALPPPVKAKTEVKPDRPPPPKGLDAIGRVAWLIWGGAQGTTVVFEFKDKQRKFFNIGEFVKKTKDDDGRFKLTEASMPEEGLYKIAYEVWEGGKKVEDADVPALQWDNRPETSDTDVIRPAVDPNTKPAAGDGTGEAEATPDAASGGTTTAGKVEEQPAVVVVGGGEKLTRKDLKPEIKVINTRMRQINFDENTYKYFKSRNTKKMIETAKTREVDLGNGKKGVMLVDPGEAPADVFDLRRNDVIVSINGQPTPDRASIIRIAEAIPETATRVTIVIDRNGRKISFNVDPRDPKTRRRAARYGEGTSGR